MPVELGMDRTVRGVYVTAELDYGLTGFAGVFVQYLETQLVWVNVTMQVWWWEVTVSMQVPKLIWSPPRWLVYYSFDKLIGISNNLHLFSKSFTIY